LKNGYSARKGFYMIDQFNRYFVYGKGACSFCKKAIDLLDEKEKESVFFDFSEDPEAIEDAKSFYDRTTVPIILENNRSSGRTTLIGGYSELVEYFND
jgi:glutaredoxin